MSQRKAKSEVMEYLETGNGLQKEVNLALVSGVYDLRDALESVNYTLQNMSSNMTYLQNINQNLTTIPNDLYALKNTLAAIQTQYKNSEILPELKKSRKN